MADITIWPRPLLINSQYRLFSIVLQPNGAAYLVELYFINGAWTQRTSGFLGESARITQVDIADFGEFYVVAGLDITGKCYSYTKAQLTINPLAKSIPHNDPCFGTCCNFRGNFLAGNIQTENPDSIWKEYGTAGIIWSEVGSYELNPEIGRTAGFKQEQFPFNTGIKPVIYSLLPTLEGIVVYSNSGVVMLRPELGGNTFTYSAQNREGIGVASGRHCAGDLYVQGYVNLDREFYVVEANGQQTKRGYKDIITHMFAEDNRIVVSYLPKDYRFYVSNAKTCLVINKFGAYQCHQKVAGAAVAPNGVLYGSFMDDLDVEARITTDNLDFGSRGIKSVESILVGLDHPRLTTSDCSVNWRMESNESFQSSDWITIGHNGESGIHVAAREFRMRTRISNYIDTRLDYLTANVKYSDQRFKRGISPTQANRGIDG
jgi:hypothetical protein